MHTHLNDLQRDFLEVYYFAIHGIGDSRLLRNVVVADCVVYVGDETTDGWLFHETKRLECDS